MHSVDEHSSQQYQFMSGPVGWSWLMLHDLSISLCLISFLLQHKSTATRMHRHTYQNIQSLTPPMTSFPGLGISKLGWTSFDISSLFFVSFTFYCRHFSCVCPCLFILIEPVSFLVTVFQMNSRTFQEQQFDSYRFWLRQAFSSVLDEKKKSNTWNK